MNTSAADVVPLTQHARRPQATCAHAEPHSHNVNKPTNQLLSAQLTRALLANKPEVTGTMIIARWLLENNFNI